MHSHDQAIEHFEALKPRLFTSFVRLDLREQYSFDICEQESLLQLWFRADDGQEVEKPFLHLSCYGVERRRDFSLLWPCSALPLQLKMTAIRQHYLRGLFFELNYFDEGYDDYNALLSCRHFEARLEETFE
jgi:hypothetical protein